MKHDNLRALTDSEQLMFRKDFQDKEGEIQKSIIVYLSALVAIAGWLIGSQSKGALELALGNGGYNIYAWLFALIVNIVFSCFLTYKGIIIHDLMQFVYYLSPKQTGLLYWEQWRRSPLSRSLRTRNVYHALLALPPIIVAAIVTAALGVLLFSNPSDLMSSMSHAKDGPDVLLAKQTSSATGENLSATTESAINTRIASENIRSTFRLARWIWLFVLLLHSFPIWFFVESVIPVNRQWAALRRLRPELPVFGGLSRLSFLETEEPGGNDESHSSK